MDTPANLSSRSIPRATKQGSAQHLRIEPLEARIAPATVAALPGNSSFEDSTDFAKWTVSNGPVTAFDEYLSANVDTSVVRGPLAPEGDAYAHLSFEGRVVSGTTGFGPSLKSETFTATAGEKIFVTWRATNGSDIAHPRGRLFTAAGAPVATFFGDINDPHSGTTPFKESSVTVSSAGQYYLLFEAGASDVSAGGTIGAKLDIDAIHRTPSPVAATTLMSGLLSVNVSGESPTPNGPNNFLITLDDTGQYAEIFVNGSLDFMKPLATIDQINVTGLGGSDKLTVDSSHGLISIAGGIHFDGAGSTDTLSLIQAGGSSHSGDAFSVGPNAGDGSSEISDGATLQTVYFQHVEPVLDNVPAASLTINGTAANNTVSSIAGTGGGNFTGATAKITVDSFSSIEFNNKTALTIKGLEGSDAITLNNPSVAAGLMGITIQGGDPILPIGDSLQYLTPGSIHPSAVGAGTITATGLPTVTFSGIEVTIAAGLTVTPGMAGLVIAAAGDQDSAGQNDAFVLTTNATPQFLALALNGSIDLYANQGAITRLDIAGRAGSDSLTLTGAGVAETFTFNATAADAGSTGITGVVAAQFTDLESVVLNALGGNDTFALGGALGTVKLIGGGGSDTVDFSGAASRVVFDLDAVGLDQTVNVSGEIVSLGDVIENFIGTAYNDTLHVRAANFLRDLKGGSNAQEIFPPGDELFFDGQGKVVTTVRVDPNTGTFSTVGYADVTFDEFESSSIGNSPSGLGFGTPGNSNAFDTAQVYDLRLSRSGGKLAPGKEPIATATGDFNADGYADMVTVNSGSASISVLLNRGDGSFGTPVSYKTRGTGPRDVAIGNFDANPGLDLAVTNRVSSTLAIFSGNNLGGFSVPTLIKTAIYPGAIAVGHLDGNASNDLVITHAFNTKTRTLNKISLLLGTGTGLAPAVLIDTVGKSPVDVVIGDFDHDGSADVATANSDTSDVSFFHGDGRGGLTAPTRYATGLAPRALAAADFNLDGVLDLAVSNRDSLFVSVLLSNGAAGATRFQPQLQIALPGKHAATAIVAADLNGDGFADLGLGNSIGTTFTVLLGGGSVKFSQPYEFDLGKFRTVPKTGGLSVADLNNDGLLDIVTSSLSTADARVLLRKNQV